MSADGKAFKAEASACLRKDAGVAALLDCIAGHFADLEVGWRLSGNVQIA
jgi:hypothetical protein